MKWRINSQNIQCVGQDLPTLKGPKVLTRLKPEHTYINILHNKNVKCKKVCVRVRLGIRDRSQWKVPIMIENVCVCVVWVRVVLVH